MSVQSILDAKVRILFPKNTTPQLNNPNPRTITPDRQQPGDRNAITY